MKVTAKLYLAFMLVVIFLAVINGFLATKREEKRLEYEYANWADFVADLIEEPINIEINEGGQTSVLQLLQEIVDEEHRIHIRYVQFGTPEGDPLYPSVPLAKLIHISDHPKLMGQLLDDDENGSLEAYWMLTASTAIELSRPFSDLQDAKQAAIHDVVYRLVLTILIAGLATGLLGTRVVARPLRKLIDKTRRVADGDLTAPVVVKSKDELGELAESLNEMCQKILDQNEKLRAETASRVTAIEQLRHADRLRTVGRLASGIAHELGTPLNVVGGRANMIASGRLSPEDVRKSAETIKAETDRITQIIRQLLDFARRSSPKRVSQNLKKIVTQTIDLLAPLAAKKDVSIRCLAVGDHYGCNVDAGQIQQVLTNLISNAVQAMPSGGHVEIDIRRGHAHPPQGEEAAEGEYVLLSVRDTGRGISADDLEQIFEPFFTTKDVGEGTGLGLSIAYGIVQEHGGWITAASEVGEGSCFTVHLPVLPNDLPSDPTSDESDEQPKEEPN